MSIDLLETALSIRQYNLTALQITAAKMTLMLSQQHGFETILTKNLIITLMKVVFIA